MGERSDTLWIGQTDLPPRRPREEIVRDRRRRRRRRLLLLSLVALAAAVGATVAALETASGPREMPRADWLGPCLLADGLVGSCGSLAVPLDPTRPDGPRISLWVGVIPATITPAKGAVFYLEGGPGGIATTAAVDAQLLFSRIERTHDIVLVDQRGAGGSSALVCSKPQATPADGRAVERWLRGCLARFPNARYFTSAAAAADLDRVRRALGYREVDVYGASYGATLAQIYARLYPSSVRSLVLDAASPLGTRVYEQEPANAQRSVDEQLAICSETAACARAYPHLKAELAAVLHRPPRLVQLADGHRYRLDATAVASTIEALSHTVDGVAVLPYDIDRAFHGNDGPLAQDFETYVGVSLDGRLRLAMAWVIQCSEPWAHTSVASAAHAPGYFRAVALRMARLFAAACGAVPHGWVPDGSERAASSDIPALVFAGTADPQSAPDIRAWRAAFPNGRVVVVAGGGHGVSADGCIPGLVASFVERRDVAGLATGCAEKRQTPRFELG